MSEIILQILGYILGAIIVFLLIREVVTWYWKINKIVDTLDRIDSNLQYIATILEEKNPEIINKITSTIDDEEVV
jgi:uncharacterized membrane protein required for colicin V production